MEESKIQLSGAELDLVCNAAIILTKNTIIRKAIHLLDNVQNNVAGWIKASGKEHYELFATSYKISRGENYEGLPYAILDFPRKTAPNSLAFIRSMFWWGNFFSSTLHLSGIYKEAFMPALSTSYPLLATHGYYIGINDDPWAHHFEVNNYKKINTLQENEFQSLLHSREHIKIAARWPLEKWHEAANLLSDSWILLSGLIT